MKKAGIIGGVGPASTLDYYIGVINRCYAEKNDYPTLTVESINMNEMLASFGRGDHDAVAEQISEGIDRLRTSGCDFAAIASNTPHIVLDRICKKSSLPIISIVEETCRYVEKLGCKRVLVTGTGFTMRSGMYKRALSDYGITAFTPDGDDLETVHNIIFPNLENGVVIPEDKEKLISLCEKYVTERGAEAVILGCTEIPLMIKDGDLSVPAVNTTEVHIEAITREVLR